MVDVSALALVDDWPVDNVAVGVIGADGEEHTRGDTGREYRWASVTKLLAANAVLVAVQEEALGLDDPAGPPGSTVRHLLAHASGLPMLAGAPIAPPGRRRIYSNVGFDRLGELVTERAGIPAADYVQEAVLEPLGLSGTKVTGSIASSARGPLLDLLTFASEWLQPKVGVLGPALMAAATSVAFPDLPGVLPGFGRQRPNDWGLGFEIRGHKSPHWTGARNAPETYGHFGRSGTFMWIDPVAGVACACLTDREFGPWAAELWPVFADALLGAIPCVP
ncbi:MAG: beta-lactamase class [Actinomycetia bacterium]|nr:beta-lactamase class [Actinomycetes bacterium]